MIQSDRLRGLAAARRYLHTDAVRKAARWSIIRNGLGFLAALVGTVGILYLVLLLVAEAMGL